ncbi:MAG: phenylalanine--tRNA ligase subunit beta [Candidatus Chromulinivorax sp.]|nr:phenylalanine--tRNA ligase subunit beta [Candidatus Chromulinivorax sp.]
MKISINWMLDHIATPISKLDVGFIVAKFNVHTAEIEHYEKFDADLNNLFLSRLISIDQNGCSVRCDELNRIISLSFRNDVQVGQLVLIRRQGDVFSWELLQKYSATKEGLFPAVDCNDNLIAGGWKQHCEDSDYIMDVDNKSINHRPDLWGHRGIAGEVAAFMGWQLKPLDQMLAQIPQTTYATQSTPGADHSLDLEIKDTAVCPRLAALYCNDVTHKASQIWMAMRLARVDSKPINTIVDITNYVMFDISQPMHVFDAANFPDKKLTVRTAKIGESIELLDGHQISLTDQDIVVTDGKTPVSLAGVMGGKKSSFSNKATSIIIESAAFKPAMIRNSATRVKLATEGATRHAKHLDPMQNTTAVFRYVFIAQAAGVIGAISEKLVSVGLVIKPLIIAVAHSFIETRLGITISLDLIVTLLAKLQFQVTIDKQAHDTIYQVTVPTLRITKDVTIPEDIVEEIVRLYGYENIRYQRPTRAMKTFDISSVMKLRKIKEYCAFSMKMREVRDYLFYDESFLKRCGWYPTDAVAIKNPVSENWKVLVTSLVPHLIKNVELNIPAHEQINFFEYNSVWRAVSSSESIENKSFAGLLFGDKHKNFYDYKADLQGLFAALDVPVVWAKCAGAVEPWFDQLQSADIMLNGIKIGRAGMLSSSFVRSVVKGQGFVFEWNMQAMLSYQVAAKRFTPWSKYQAVSVDISMLVDALTTSQTLEALILQADEKIDTVSLIDFFEKDSWVGKRSLTFRYRICDFEQNLTKEVIDSVTNKVTATMLSHGAEIR